MVSHLSDKSCDHKHCDGGDIIFLMCHVTSRELMFKGIYGFISETPPSDSPPCHAWWPLV